MLTFESYSVVNSDSGWTEFLYLNFAGVERLTEKWRAKYRFGTVQHVYFVCSCYVRTL